MSNIKLFYIDILDRYPKTTLIEQYVKMQEEMSEILASIDRMDKDNLIEECWDIIQATLSFINVAGLEEEFEQGFEKHKQKLLKRRYKIKEI